MTPSPHNIFHASPAQRVELARQRYFEEGLAPTGFVSEAVMQSWARCQRSRYQLPDAPRVQPSQQITRAVQVQRPPRVESFEFVDYLAAYLAQVSGPAHQGLAVPEPGAGEVEQVIHHLAHAGGTVQDTGDRLGLQTVQGLREE